MALLPSAHALLSRRQTLGLSLWPFVALGATPLCAQPLVSDQTVSHELSPRIYENLLTRMAVEVGLGSGRKAMFVIDTGAERTALSDRLVAQMGLGSGPPMLVHGITTSQITPSAILPRIHVMQRRFDQLILPVFEHGLLGADGLLGLDILSHFRLTLDLRSQRVMMAPSGSDVVTRSFSIGRASRLRAEQAQAPRGRFGQLYMTQLEVGGVPAIGFVDSGAQFSIANHALMRALKNQNRMTTHGQVQVYGVIGQSMMAHSGSAPSLKIERWTFGQTPLLFADLHAFTILNLLERPAMLLGADIISHFNRVTLDFGQSQVNFSGLIRTGGMI